MKLADLLARELESWPDCAKYITQDSDGEVWPCTDPLGDLQYCGSQWTSTNGFKIGRNIIPVCQLSSDHSTAIITLEMWQSARDKLKGETKVPKANKDGWIRHRGGRCPVAEGTIIDVRYRDGVVHESVEALLSSDCEQDNWIHEKDKNSDLAFCDIMAYRIHAPEQADPVDKMLIAAVQKSEARREERTLKVEGFPGLDGEYVAKQATSDAPMPAAKYFDGPLQWRDRIKEIDATQEAAEVAHKAATDARYAEKAELVAKLKAEGLALINEPIKAEDSAQG